MPLKTDKPGRVTGNAGKDIEALFRCLSLLVDELGFYLEKLETGMKKLDNKLTQLEKKVNESGTGEV